MDLPPERNYRQPVLPERLKKRDYSRQWSHRGTLVEQATGARCETMDDFECPCCHQRTFPFWRKVLLSPAFSATCPNCGGKVTLPQSAWAFSAVSVEVINL
jgi:hypothetical protein